MASVALRNVTKRYGDTQALSAVDIEMYDRELTVVVGPSGCGKSTLLRIVAGLEDVDQGDVLIGGERVNHLLPVRRNIAMVFHILRALPPHDRVRQHGVSAPHGKAQAGCDRGQSP